MGCLHDASPHSCEVRSFDVIDTLIMEADDLGLIEPAQSALALVAFLWLVHYVPILPEGVMRPRSPDILGSIIVAQLKHADQRHLIGNCIGLLIAVTYFVWKFENPYGRLVALFLVAGALHWLIGDSNVQSIGASKFIYAIEGWLVAWFFLSGMQDTVLGVLVALILMSWFRGSGDSPQVNYEGHALGAAAGAVLAWAVIDGRTPSWI